MRIDLSAIPGFREGSVHNAAFSDVDHEQKVATDCPPGNESVKPRGVQGVEPPEDSALEACWEAKWAAGIHP